MPANPLKWNATAYKKQFEAGMARRVKAAATYLAAEIKAEISQPGTLRYHPLGKNGKARKTQKTVYNFTHSRPGNPPFKQTGNLPHEHRDRRRRHAARRAGRVEHQATAATRCSLRRAPAGWPRGPTSWRP